jgi:hypothetical protein
MLQQQQLEYDIDGWLLNAGRCDGLLQLESSILLQFLVVTGLAACGFVGQDMHQTPGVAVLSADGSRYQVPA